ncbi:MAG: IS1380 family transposase [Candidatus Methylomirabilales bacterium]
MRDHSTQEAPSERLEIAYTTKPVSGWGGLVMVLRYFDQVGLRTLLQQALPDGRTSPNQIPAGEIILAFFAAVLTGAKRFAHVERLRADEVVRAILGVTRIPSAMTLTRYLGGFVRSQVEHLTEVLWRFTVARLRASPLGAVLDLDSTVFERYGHQEGARRGHNPRKHGRPSHHPLLAMLAEAKVVWNVWLRSGNAGTARGVAAFLAETLAQLPPGWRLYALRADAGFFVTELLDFLEARGLPYAIAVRMNRLVHRQIVGLRTWRPFGPGLEVAETWYQGLQWPAARRLVVVRERIQDRPEARGRRLFEIPGYTFHAVVTTLPLPPEDVWRFYNSRADSENRLKELKDDFGARGFSLQAFDGTEAAFRLICFLFNLVALFKRDVTGNERPQLTTLRSRLLVVGAILGARGRRPILRLGLTGRLQARFAALLDRIATLAGPTVAQLATWGEMHGFSPPSRWRTRKSPSAFPRFQFRFS